MVPKGLRAVLWGKGANDLMCAVITFSRLSINRAWCVCVCVVITFSRLGVNRVWLPILLVVS